jgi:CBS domain-containing protein
MTRDPKTLPGDMPLDAAARFFADEATHRSYPVVDNQGRLLGLVSRTDALEWKVNRKTEGKLAEALSDASTQFAFPETPCGEVADIMVESGIGRVPIVEPEDRRVVGIISRQDLLKVRSRQKSGETRKATG